MADARTSPTKLAELLSPVTVASFFADTWERTPLHLRRGDPRVYEAVLTPALLDAFVNGADLRYPAIQLAKNGRYFPEGAYTSAVKYGSETFAGVPDLDIVRAEYRSGATVVLPAMHRTHAPLRALCSAMEGELGHPVHANVYMTPGGALGFAPHYDTHEVFVLQVGGQKTWRVFDPPIELPHRGQPFNPIGYTLPEPRLTVTLETGDLLYLPRGFVHTAATSTTFSAHVTLGVTVYTWIELLAELIQEARALPEMRAALPPGFATDDAVKGALPAALAARIERLRDQVGARLVDAFLQRLAPTRRTPAVFASEVAVLTLDVELRVNRREEARVVAAGGAVALEIGGRRVSLPAPLVEAAKAMLGRATFRVRDLPGEPSGTLALARFLEDEGLVSRVSGA